MIDERAIFEMLHQDAWRPVYDKLLAEKLIEPGETIYAALNRRASELTSLRSQLEEARAIALEEAAKYHDDLEAQHEAAHRHVESDHHAIMEREHRRHAAAIRKLKGVTKPKPVPSLGKLFDDLATKQRLIGEEFEKFMTDVEDTTEEDDEGAIRKLKEKP